MKLKNKIFGGLLRLKNRQLREERANSRALRETNSILSAYVASLIEEKGGVRISRDKIRASIGSYAAEVRRDGGDYVITVRRFTSGNQEMAAENAKNENLPEQIESQETEECADVRE